jgi:hypothetical protein
LEFLAEALAQHGHGALRLIIGERLALIADDGAPLLPDKLVVIAVGDVIIDDDKIGRGDGIALSNADGQGPSSSLS